MKDKKDERRDEARQFDEAEGETVKSGEVTKEGGGREERERGKRGRGKSRRPQAIRFIRVRELFFARSNRRGALHLFRVFPHPPLRPSFRPSESRAISTRFADPTDLKDLIDDGRRDNLITCTG